MARVIYGPAVVEPTDSAIVMLRMVKLYLTEFNIIPVDDHCLIVFRKVADCERYCKRHGVSVVEEAVRYTPKINLILEVE